MRKYIFLLCILITQVWGDVCRENVCLVGKGRYTIYDEKGLRFELYDSWQEKYHITGCISAGYLHTCGVTSSGKAYCWGNAQTSLPSVNGWRFINSAGHNCGLTQPGNIYCWGNDGNNQLSYPINLNLTQYEGFVAGIAVLTENNVPTIVNVDGDLAGTQVTLLGYLPTDVYAENLRFKANAVIQGNTIQGAYTITDVSILSTIETGSFNVTRQ